MGGNMARRLNECGFAVTAVYDTQAASARELAGEIGAKCCPTLAEVTANADIIFTVVTDDPAQLAVFAETGDSLLRAATGKISSTAPRSRGKSTSKSNAAPSSRGR